MHVTQLGFGEERRAVAEFQIAQIGNVGTVEQIIDPIHSPMQAILCGEAVNIGRKIWQAVFDIREERREQNPDAQTNKNEGCDDCNKPGENGKNCFHALIVRQIFWLWNNFTF